MTIRPPSRTHHVHGIPLPSHVHIERCAGLLLLVMTVAVACDASAPAPPGATMSVADLLGGADTLHARAIEPRAFTFPLDHGPHPDYRTEWWYFTGNLTTPDGRELGYQLTFFRSALTDSASYAAANSAASGSDVATGGGADVAGATGAGAAAGAGATAVGGAAGASAPSRSPWRSRHAYMAHFAVSDAATGQFEAAERFARAAQGLAGATAEPLRIWLEDWSAESLNATTFPLRLRASAGDIAIDLVVERGKPIVLQGDRGLSRKGPEPGNASYYYSMTRMPTRGTIRTAEGTWTASGTSWLDREWSTSVLSPGVTGWDWLSLQMDDSTELMMYRLRRADDAVDPFSAATFVAPDGSTRSIPASGFTMAPTRSWTSADGTAYPVAWRITVPALDLALDVAAAIDDQELNLAVRYWEGMVQATGTRAGGRVTGRGYLELTGYDSPANRRTRR